MQETERKWKRLREYSINLTIKFNRNISGILSDVICMHADGDTWQK